MCDFSFLYAKIVPKNFYNVMEFIQDRTTKNFSDILRSAGRIYFHLSSVMFFAFASALVIQLRNIRARIRSVTSSDTDTTNLLENLNSHLFTTCVAISELGKYFSIIFLLSVSCIFVQSITFCHMAFRIISGTEKRDIYTVVVTFEAIIRMIFILNAICYKADEIKDEVYTFQK